MGKIYVDAAIFRATLDFRLNHNIDGLLDVKLNFTTNSGSKGHFNINLESMAEQWKIQDFKKFNEILAMSDTVNDSALFIHDYIVQVVNELIKAKSILIGDSYINDRKRVDDRINRLIKFNEVLTDSYGIESINIETTPKYKKCIVYSTIYVEGRMQIKAFEGLQFDYMGYTLQVYSDDNKRKHIIIPSCGSSIKSFMGNIRVAHEYLENIGYLSDPNNQEKIENLEKRFRELMAESGIEIPDICKSIIKKDCIDLVNEITSAPAVESVDCNIKRFSRRFGSIYNDLYNCESSGLEVDYTDKIDLFDGNMEVLKPIISAFTSFRGDFISSDRECAAFIMTLEYYLERGYNTIVGASIPELSVESSIMSTNYPGPVADTS